MATEQDDAPVRRLRVDPGMIRRIRLFTGPPGAPRSRRPTDAVLLVASLLLLLGTSWLADPPGAWSDDLTQVVEGSPEWVLSIWLVFFDLLPVWAAIVVVLSIIRRHFVLAVAEIAAVVVGFFVAYGSHRLALEDHIAVEDFVRLFTVSEGPAEFPGVRLVAGSAVLVVASPSITRPFRFFGRVLLLLAVLAGIGLSTVTIAGSVGGLATGVAAAAAVHLVIGSPGGRPSREEVRTTAAQLGVPVQHVEPAQVQPAGVVLMNATGVDDRRLAVKVYGRDAWDSQLIAKMWRWLWYRDGRRTVLLSRLHQVEHEALMTVLAGRAGARVPDVLVAGQASDGDAALVTSAGGPPLSEVADQHPGTDIDRCLVDLCAAMGLVHRRGIVHGALDLERVALDADGVPLIVDWAGSSVAAGPEAIESERAGLLVLTALLVGSQRATAIVGEAFGVDALAGIIPFLQSAALTTELRREVRDRDFDLDELRAVATEAAGIDEVELVQLRRVSLKSVLSMALVAVAALLLLSSLAEIGLDTIVDELSTAIWGWVLIGLVVAQCARVFTAIGTTGATSHPLRLGPTVVLEFAITFVNLVMPSSAARIATKMRYFQKAGMTLTSATAMGAIDSLAGFTVQVLILVSALLFGIGGVEFDIDVDVDSVKRLAALVAVVVIVMVIAAVIALIFSQKVRHRIAGPLRQVREALAVVRSPARLLRLFGGNLAAEITFAAVLGFCLLAYGGSASIVSLLVINVGVALLAGLMPVPGGIGVAEAGLTAGLVAIGIPEATAFATAITTRLCTFYLPPIWGYFALRWLRTNDYL